MAQSSLVLYRLEMKRSLLLFLLVLILTFSVVMDSAGVFTQRMFLKVSFVLRVRAISLPLDVFLKTLTFKSGYFLMSE